MRTTNTNSSCHTPYVLPLPLTLNVADRIPHGVAPAIDLHTFARNYQMQILSMSFSWAYVRYYVESQKHINAECLLYPLQRYCEQNIEIVLLHSNAAHTDFIVWVQMPHATAHYLTLHKQVSHIRMIRPCQTYDCNLSLVQHATC